MICAAICLLAVPCSGCGSATATAEPVTLTFVHWYFEEDYYDRLVQKFNESHPDITIKLSPRFQSGPGRGLSTHDSDVLVVTGADLIGLQERGEILNMEPFINRDGSFSLSSFYPDAVKFFTIENQVWAIPAGVDPVVMYYNQDLFDHYGVPYPEVGWTWDDFLDAALTLRDDEADTFGYAPRPSHLDAMLFVYQHDGRIYDILRNPTRTTFDAPLTVEALEWYASLYHDYDVAPTTRQALEAFRGGSGESRIWRAIYNGQVGMWAGSLSERSGGSRLRWLSAEWAFNWGMVPLPSDAQSAAGAHAEGYAISSTTSNPDACWQWITFLSEQMGDRMMPARKSLAESTAYEQQIGEEITSVARASMENALPISPAMLGFRNAGEIFSKAVDKIIDEGATPQEAMDWAQREAASPSITEN
jgi:multiple sugar transport system substrate-binding protein